MSINCSSFNLEMPIFNGFRYSEGLPIFETRLKCIPQAAADRG